MIQLAFCPHCLTLNQHSASFKLQHLLSGRRTVNRCKSPSSEEGLQLNTHTDHRCVIQCIYVTLWCKLAGTVELMNHDLCFGIYFHFVKLVQLCSCKCLVTFRQYEPQCCEPGVYVMMPFTFFLWAELNSEHICSLSCFKSTLLLVVQHCCGVCPCFISGITNRAILKLPTHINVPNNYTCCGLSRGLSYVKVHKQDTQLN